MARGEMVHLSLASGTGSSSSEQHSTLLCTALCLLCRGTLFSPVPPLCRRRRSAAAIATAALQGSHQNLNTVGFHEFFDSLFGHVFVVQGFLCHIREYSHIKSNVFLGIFDLPTWKSDVICERPLRSLQAGALVRKFFQEYRIQIVILNFLWTY